MPELNAMEILTRKFRDNDGITLALSGVEQHYLVMELGGALESLFGDDDTYTRKLTGPARDEAQFLAGLLTRLLDAADAASDEPDEMRV
jgi:hypothetical protein